MFDYCYICRFLCVIKLIYCFAIVRGLLEVLLLHCCLKSYIKPSIPKTTISTNLSIFSHYLSFQ
jgi:hypothetical protein